MKPAIILPALITAFVALLPAGVALADRNPSGTGQPNQEATLEPGSSPPGFLTGIGQGATTKGFANAEAKYANPDSTGGLNSGNTHVVSQYDVAGFQWCQHHPSASC
jgi:hypothetical protein